MISSITRWSRSYSLVTLFVRTREIVVQKADGRKFVRSVMIEIVASFVFAERGTSDVIVESRSGANSGLLEGGFTKGPWT